MRVLVVCILMAGCAQTTPADEPLPGQPTKDLEPFIEPWVMELDDCVEVAGVAVYDLRAYQPNAPPAPWVVKDISQYVGNPRIGSVGGVIPPIATTGVAGHWHNAMSCAGVSWGWVGVAVETPEWANDECLHVLTVVWSWPGEHAEEVARHGHATVVQQADARRTANAASMILEDAHHGQYETQGAVFAYDVSLPCRVHWLLLPTEGMHNDHSQSGPYELVGYRLNLQQSGSPDYFVTQDASAAFAHTKTDHHAPLPGLGGNVAMVVSHFEGVEVTVAPAPNVTFAESWVH